MHAIAPFQCVTENIKVLEEKEKPEKNPGTFLNRRTDTIKIEECFVDKIQTRKIDDIFSLVRCSLFCLLACLLG